MIWESKTDHFSREEMAAIELRTAEQLITPIVAADPLVALRVLAELLLHDDEERLNLLLQNDAINKRWMVYDGDSEADARDQRYASELLLKVQALHPDAPNIVVLRYPRSRPKWVQATRVQEASIDGYVNVWVGDKTYGIHRISWANSDLDKTKRDCLVEDSEIGWLRIWWNISDLQPRP